MEKKGAAICLSLILCISMSSASMAVVSREDKFPPLTDDFSYTVNQPIEEVYGDLIPLGYEKALASFTQAEGYVVDQLLEAPTAAAVLRHQDIPAVNGDPAYRDYQLYLIFKDDTAPEAFCRQVLPSTLYLTNRAYAPTDRGPDSMSLSEDEKTLTYMYFFDSPLADSKTVYHEAGIYTYTVDMSTGELAVVHTAVQDSRFSDVLAESWFGEGVALCAEKGVMVGTGRDTFSPEAQLTKAECLTLAFRLYDLVRGQEHVIEKAPEKDKLTLTLADGTVFEGYACNPGVHSTFSWWSGNGRNVEGLYMEVPGWSSDIKAGAKAQQEWMDAHPDVQGSDRPATLTLNGVTYQGTTHCWLPAGPFVIMFRPEPEKAEEVNSILRQAIYQGTSPDLWWWDTAYTITQRGLVNIFNPVYFTDDSASRGFFAQLIAAACEGHLEKLNAVETIPDLSRAKNNTTADAYREAVYTLYEAGILSGIDNAGTFAADATLTRAEAAVMAARIIDENLRIKTEPPKIPPIGIP